MLANNALTTLEQAKSFLGIDPLDVTKDETIYLFINSASGYIQKYCDRVFGLTWYDEFKQGRGSNKLVLTNFPVIELEELEVGPEKVDVDTVRVLHDTGMLFRPLGGFPSHTISGRFMHPRPDHDSYNIYVRYSSGYILPKDETLTEPRTLPYDLELACLKMIRIMDKDKDSAEGKNLILKREKIGDWMGEYEPEHKTAGAKLSFFDPDVMNILSLYKRTEFSL